MDEDDDSFLYGDPQMEPEPTVVLTSVPQPIALEKTPSSSNGVIAHLEAKAEDESAEEEVQLEDEGEGFEVAVEDGDEDESEEDDVEIIMEPTSRSLDFRQNPPARPSTNRAVSATYVTPSKVPQPSLTTEYTPRERGGVSGSPSKTSPTPQPTQPSTTPISTQTDMRQLSSSVKPEGQGQSQDQAKLEDGADPSTLPPVTAPPSHPSINPSLPGTLDGRSILEVDIGAMAEKPWRRPGSDLSDWFNYGFDEVSWEAYCYRRRDLGELANVLKTNVLNFAGMPEDQLAALPPEIRTMVMTGANAMMSGGAPNPGIMGPGVGMNPMMDMGGMGPINMGPMGMGMNGDMGMQMQGGGPMMQEGPGPGPVGSSVTPEQGVQMGMQDGFGPGGPGQGMMGMGMAPDFGMQQEANPIGQPMYPGMDGSGTPGPGGRGGTPVQYRGRGGMSQGMRGRGGGFAGRGRGRGGIYAGGEGERPPVPVRPASPLPPGVPTGPRNQNKYKDRDGNAPAVDGLDYGGTNKESGGRTSSAETDERGGGRKRRSSPALDDSRGLKRR